jgi:hypothetical protein
LFTQVLVLVFSVETFFEVSQAEINQLNSVNLVRVLFKVSIDFITQQLSKCVPYRLELVWYHFEEVMHVFIEPIPGNILLIVEVFDELNQVN